MSFDLQESAKLLADCHRRCSICHRYCGRNMELHHIDKSGGDEIENAIPLCFDCHAEVGHYDTKHPRGRKYSIVELNIHKSNWLSICKSKPEIFTAASIKRDVGPLEGIIQELKYNKCVAEKIKEERQYGQIGAKLMVSEFRRAQREGSLLIFKEEALANLNSLYALTSKANTHLEEIIQARDTSTAKHAQNNHIQALDNIVKIIDVVITEIEINIPRSKLTGYF